MALGQFRSFTIKNFKGIKELTIAVGDMPLMLLGLNESGKSTIMEAISHFDLSERSADKHLFNQLIPVHQRGQLAEPILLTAEIELDSEKRSALSRALSARGPAGGGRVRISIDLSTPHVANVNDGSGPPRSLPAKKLIGIIPLVKHFREFNIDIPQRIFLRPGYEDSTHMAFHRDAIANIIAEACSPTETLGNLIIDRVENLHKRNPKELDGEIGKNEELKAILTRIDACIDQRMSKTWHLTFQRESLRNLHIRTMVGYDEHWGCPYLSYQVEHGAIPYAVSERSSGFRWFFCFLLSSFTSEKDALLLYDEPGNHLHGRGQKQIIEMLKELSKFRQIIYSTHRPHLIEPAWLETAYFVDNEAHRARDLRWYSPTTIRAMSYPDVVGQYGKVAEREGASVASQFQPAVELLLVSAPSILEIDDGVLVEGKSDYYVYRYFASLYQNPLPRFYPGAGAGALGPMISMLIGRNARFIVLCDSDQANLVKKYHETYSYPRGKFLTLFDINPKFENKKLEDLISENTIKKIAELLNLGEKSTKTIVLNGFNRFLSQQLPDDSINDAIDQETRGNLETLFAGIFGEFSALPATLAAQPPRDRRPLKVVS